MAKEKMPMQMEMNTLYLPSELITEILLMLSVKSLIRFKCVCKSWSSLISHPDFANSHFQITSASRIFYMSNQFQFIDYEFNRGSTTLNHDFLLPLPRFSHSQIKGSCRGFVFLHGKVDMWIWNPASGIHKQIPLSPFDLKLCAYRNLYLFGFGYDHSRDDYLVVILTFYGSSHLEFFSLRDNMWNEIGGPHFTYLNINRNHIGGCGSFINGVVHWLAERYDLLVDVIVAFDLMERKLFEMPFPKDFHHYHRENYGIWVFGEFLSIWANDYRNHTIEIWVMKEYKLHSSWTKTLVIPAKRGIPFDRPLCRTKSGDIIGIDGGRLVKYNDKGQLLDYLRIGWSAYKLALYTESLFSLPDDRELV